jgi:NADPH-dependent 2,4-dienoyl-CoA reductase/sulfur reductase-like enzyme
MRLVEPKANGVEGIDIGTAGRRVRTAHTSYSACGIPYFISGLVGNADALVARSPETFRQKYAIDVRTNHDVTDVDIEGRRVRVRAPGGDAEFWEPYGELLIATGALPVWPDLPGGRANGIFGLSTLASGIAVHRYLDRERPRTAVIVGGGYIGLEMAEALVRRGLDVALVERAKEVMGTLDPDTGALVSAALREIGVALYLEESATGFETADGRVSAVVTDRRTLPTDLVILGLGVTPNTQLLKETGVALGDTGAIRVDERLQTSVAGVWAAGD